MKRALVLTLSLLWICVSGRAEVCAGCHRSHFERQARSRHALALRPIAETALPEGLASQPLRERSGIEFQYGFMAERFGVAVLKGTNRIFAPLEWAFGAGAQGQTPVGIYKDKYFEHRISYYPESRQAARTLGHPGEASKTLEGALGLVLAPGTAYRCFNCHATGVRWRGASPDLSRMQPGVTCERCHSGGGEHVAAARQSGAAAEIRSSISNPGRFTPKALIAACGECHRSPEADGNIADPLTIRFQPVGLLASKCFRKGEELSCLTCHNPHEDVRREWQFYASKCLGCHPAAVKVESDCKRQEKQNCLPCHMPRSSPAPFLSFTDHRIH